MFLIFFRNWNNNDSLFGSRHLAEKWDKNTVPPVGLPNSPPFSIENIQLFALFDLLGTILFSFIGSSDTNIAPLFRATFPYYQKLSYVQKRLFSQKLISASHYFREVTSTPFGFGVAADDHTPFQQRGLLNILHLIVVPFPKVWHKQADNVDALNYQNCRDLALIFKNFVQEFSVLP
jgi:glutaminyl-peptide cyclotransferase